MKKGLCPECGLYMLCGACPKHGFPTEAAMEKYIKQVDDTILRVLEANS